MTDKQPDFFDLSPINSSKSSASNSFFSPRNHSSPPKPQRTRLSLTEKPSILLKTQPNSHENPLKIGFNPTFRVNFLRDLEKKGFSINKTSQEKVKTDSCSTLTGQIENSTQLSSKKPSLDWEKALEQLKNAEDREKELKSVIHSLEAQILENRRVSGFLERNFTELQQDNRKYLEENCALKENIFKLKEKVNKKNTVIKQLKDQETTLKEEFSVKIKEKDEQINKFMQILSVFPEVYKEKLEENKKKINPASFHAEEKTPLEKEKKILKEICNNIESQGKTETKAAKIVKNTGVFRQKKLSCDINSKFDFQAIMEAQTTKNSEKFKEYRIFSCSTKNFRIK